MRKKSVLHTICVMMPMAYRASPLRFWTVNGLGILQSAVMAANTVLLAGFVDALIRSLGKGEADGMLVLWTVLLWAETGILRKKDSWAKKNTQAVMTCRIFGRGLC